MRAKVSPFGIPNDVGCVFSRSQTPTIHIDELGISGGGTGVELAVKEVEARIVFVVGGLQCPRIVAHAIKQIGAAFKGARLNGAEMV